MKNMLKNFCSDPIIFFKKNLNFVLLFCLRPFFIIFKRFTCLYRGKIFKYSYGLPFDFDSL